jgi:hypothetical protein
MYIYIYIYVCVCVYTDGRTAVLNASKTEKLSTGSEFYEG